MNDVIEWPRTGGCGIVMLDKWNKMRMAITGMLRFLGFGMILWH